MSMITRHSLDHIADARARDAIQVLRDTTTGFRKVYGSRYLQALAKVCKYEVAVDREGFSISMHGMIKQFPNAKSVGLYMEATINDKYALGVL